MCFLHAASKDLDGQQVCTVGDHAEEAAQVPSTIEQQHEGLSRKFAHRVRMVHDSQSNVSDKPGQSRDPGPKPGVHVRQGTLVDTHVIPDHHEHSHSRRRSWINSKAVVSAGASTARNSCCNAIYSTKGGCRRSPARAGTSTRRMSCNPSCCPVCEAREDSHGNRNFFFKSARAQSSLPQNGYNI